MKIKKEDWLLVNVFRGNGKDKHIQVYKYIFFLSHRKADLLLQDFVSNHLNVTEVKGHKLFKC